MAEDQAALRAELQRLREENARLEAAYANEAERFALAFFGTHVPMLITSFELGRYVEVNGAYCHFTGYSREEILNYDAYQFWVDTTPHDDFEAERKELQRLVDGTIMGYTVQRRFKLKNGDLRWGELTSNAVRDERGRLRYALVHVSDIHEQRLALAARDDLEARLRQSQKLEAVGRLVGGVAHDFNNRLLVIMGYAELIKRGVAGDAMLEAHADVVLSSSQRAADLTRQLLAYSRRQVLRPRPSDLNAVVDGMRRMLERVIGERIELLTVLGAKNQMLADAGQVEQVVMNLMLNARDAMPLGGRVTVETYDVVVTPEAPVADLDPGDYVALSVTDTGGGIPDTVRDHIFEPFYTTKEIGKGTGLGLATVDGIVRQSGGSIAVKTAEGKGSTFIVYLPRGIELPEAAPHLAPGEPAARLTDLETVLIVDDEDDVRRLLVDVIRIGAYHVLEARDGDHALEVASQYPEPIDLLITDLVMPRMTGMELADRLVVVRPEIKVLFMSGYAEREHLRELKPNEQYIPKPFLPADLFRRVNEFLKTRKGTARVDRSA